MELPAHLATAVDRMLAGTPAVEISQATRRLSERYRALDPTQQFVESSADVAAYLAYRLPATYAASSAALSAVARGIPDWRPHSLLDVGAGPGTVAWAATEIWPDIEHITLLERDARMIAAGKSLADWADLEPLCEAQWVQADVAHMTPPGKADLVVAAYALGELQPDLVGDLTESLWNTTSGVLLLIEPGSPAGFARIRAARAHLIALGSTVAAPCPHDGDCPMTGSDWCHFSQRLARSHLHRAVKAGIRGFEDEKFSYCAATRLPVPPRADRVLRHPRVRPGLIDLELCTSMGLKHRVITRRDAAAWREARHIEWGYAIPSEQGLPPVKP